MTWYLIGVCMIVTIAAFLFALGLCKAAASDVGGNQKASALASPRPDVPESSGFGAAAATETPSRPDLTTAGKPQQPVR